MRVLSPWVIDKTCTWKVHFQTWNGSSLHRMVKNNGIKVQNLKKLFEIRNLAFVTFLSCLSRLYKVWVNGDNNCKI